PKYLEKYARKMRARRYETDSEGKFASRWRAKSPDALCAVLPKSCPIPFYPLACLHRIKQRQHRSRICTVLPKPTPPDGKKGGVPYGPENQSGNAPCD
ncbi:hypothetical protein, partial [uncultured Ruminococcus sp.]|uniref:hypothetical protein n=1 Tax=uncultured Ruminococcus sp. TaxID=165186 RepID=UPI0026DB6D26